MWKYLELLNRTSPLIEDFFLTKNFMKFDFRKFYEEKFTNAEATEIELNIL